MRRVELRLKQATPALIGHTSPNRIDPRYYLRPSSLKGVWRWTLRAIIAGVLYDSCLLQGVPGRVAGSPGVYRVPAHGEVKRISHIVGSRLGMGFAGSRGAAASAFRLRVEVNPWQRPRIGRASAGYLSGKRLQRVVLQTLGRRRIEYFEGGMFNVRVDVVRSLPKEELELAIRGLILALTIMGIGKGSRRALGSFDVVLIRAPGTPALEELGKSLAGFINRTRELALEVIRKDLGPAPEGCRPKHLPPMPVVSRAVINNFKVTQVLKTSAPWIEVHEFFARPQRCRKLHGTSVCYDSLRRMLAAWVLGLPRGRGRRTGYQPGRNTGVDRRASPIIVSSHSNRHLLGGGVYVTVMASADWPREVQWRGGGGQRRIIVDDNVIIEALDTAVGELLQYLGTNNVSPIWP